MDAITLDSDIASLRLDRCIGCGLCVTTCLSDAISLIKKPDDMLYEPPEDYVDLSIKMGIERGMI